MTFPRAIPTPDLLRQILRYEPETGKLYWLPRDLSLCASERHMKMFNSQFGDKEACTADNGDGYRCGHIFGRTMRAHRVIWAIVHGEWPALQIDHVNGDRSDNRLCNLRQADAFQNAHNQRVNTKNTSGYRGVHKVPNKSYWQARITVKGKRLSLGLFGTAHEAHLAYCRASREHHGEFGRVA